MELVSAYVVVIGLVTFILMLLSKKSCTNLFIAGMVASFATIEILTKGASASFRTNWAGNVISQNGGGFSPASGCQRMRPTSS
jgi:hypothetical protein